MKPLTRDWIAKAEGDFTAMEREHRARKNPVYDVVCFHDQQCVEMYFKARLQEARVRFSRTQDLESLLASLIVVEPLWEFSRDELKWLSARPVEVRYPGEFADKDDAKRAVTVARQIRRIVRRQLRLK